jgi:hypothetical protein
LEPASEQFTQSDVTFWGIVALACGAFAIVCANVGALMPTSVLTSLRAARIEGAGIEQLQAQLVRLQGDSQRLHSENELLQNRFFLAEQSQGDVARRVGTLEVSIPNLLEALPVDAQIDRSINTAGIGDAQGVTFNVDGGSVTVRNEAMTQFDGTMMSISAKQPMPAMPAPVDIGPKADDKAFGIAVGPAVTDSNAQSAWQDLLLKMGALLMGLGPLVADEGDAQSKRLIVGPMPDMAQATDLCRRMEKVAIACEPVPFMGKPL